MPKSNGKPSLSSYDDIFSTEESRTSDIQEQVQQIRLDQLVPFRDHPFKVVQNEDMEKMVESVKDFGIMAPLIARPLEDGQFEIISGHRRQYAAQQAGLETLPVIVRNLDDDEATILMVDSNLHREEILPSERAKALKMKLDAIKHQGTRSDLTSTQIAQKLSVEKVGDDAGISKDTVRRYIRLNNLIPELLDMVDSKEIGMSPAVELSYLSHEEQEMVLDGMDYSQNTPSLSQAQRLKKMSTAGKCDQDAVNDVLSEDKKGEDVKITIKGSELRRFFPKNYTPQQMQDTIIKLLTQWQKKRERDQQR